jgi:lipopolysaccharide transport system ATP-binding protein
LSDNAIVVEKLGKRYSIGRRRGTDDGMRHAIEQAVRSPLSWFRQRREEKQRGKEFWALRDVSFSIKSGEVVGIIGRNGAGKSTLLKLLSRITEPTEGRIRISGRIASLLEVGTGFHQELTGRENIFLNGAILGMSRTEIIRKFDEIVAFSEVEEFLDTPVKRYSSGMYVRLAFAVAAHLDPEILIVDEVLAVGDAGFQKKCMGKINDIAANQKRTVVFVSHSMSAIRSLCSRVVLMEHGRVVSTGDVDSMTSRYLEATVRSCTDHSEGAHVIFKAPIDAENERDFLLTKFELVDVRGEPKPKVSTWDAVAFRIHFYSRHQFQSGAVEFQVRTLDGVPVLRFSTQPDCKIDIRFDSGHQWIDCMVAELPLAAGHYVIAGGLTVPDVKYLCWSNEIGILEVHPKDVFSSGLPPSTGRALVASKNVWKSNNIASRKLG